MVMAERPSEAMRKDRRRRNRPGCGRRSRQLYGGPHRRQRRQGLCLGADLPCYGVSTLEAMARSLGVYQGYVLGVMDARRSQVYAGLFHAGLWKIHKSDGGFCHFSRGFKGSSKNAQNRFFWLATGVFLCYNTLLESVPALVLPPGIGCTSVPTVWLWPHWR